MKHLRISQPPSYSESELYQIGYVHSTQGLKGDIFIVLKSTDIAWFDQWEDLILKASSTKAPQNSFMSFEIENLREHKKQGRKGVVARLFDLESCNDVEALVGHEVWIPKSFMESKEGENFFLAELLNFQVIDVAAGPIGQIVGFSTNGVQDLLEVKSAEGKEYLIPLVKAFIDRIDNSEKTIYMKIPEGLLDLA